MGKKTPATVRTGAATNCRRNWPRRETRLKKIREAKRALEARARGQAEAEGSDPKQAKPKEEGPVQLHRSGIADHERADGFVQAYNAQAAVEPDFQLIVGQDGDAGIQRQETIACRWWK